MFPKAVCLLTKASAKNVKTETVIGSLDMYEWVASGAGRLPSAAEDVKAVRAAVQSLKADGGDTSSMTIRERLVDQEFPYIDIRLQLARDGISAQQSSTLRRWMCQANATTEIPVPKERPALVQVSVVCVKTKRTWSQLEWWG